MSVLHRRAGYPPRPRRMSSRVVGATLAVVTPETRDFPRRLKRDLDLKVLSDIDYGVGVSYGVLFRVPDETKAHYSGLGFDLGARHGAPDWMRSWSPTSRYARNRRKSWPRRAGPLPRPSWKARHPAPRPRYPNLEAWLRRFQSRPAYLAAFARGGAYALAE